MKNKKGFTMVELLATITILGILSTVAVVGFNSYLVQSRENSYNNMAKTLYEATKDYFITNSDKIPKRQETASASLEITEISALTLYNEKYIEKLVDPANNRDDCHASRIKVTNPFLKDSDGFNDNLKYEITLICNGKEVNSEKINTKFPREKINP